MIYFDSDYGKRLAQEIDKATSAVDVCMYVWRFYENDPQSYVQQVFIALLRAASRGVRVRILTHFPDVAAKLKHQGLDVVLVPSTRILHAKMFIIDERTVCLGSHNMTKRSLERNHEASLIISEPAVVRRAGQYFETLWGNYAKSGAYI